MFECHSYRAKTRSLCTQEIVSRQPFLTDFMSWVRTIRKEFDRQGLGSREGIQIVAGERGRLHLRVLSEHKISGSQGRRWAPCGNKLKRVTTHVHPTWHAYVDASSEGGSDMPGGIGGVLILLDFGPVSFSASRWNSSKQ